VFATLYIDVNKINTFIIAIALVITITITLPITPYIYQEKKRANNLPIVLIIC
jgi:hypothetical protein